ASHVKGRLDISMKNCKPHAKCDPGRSRTDRAVGEPGRIAPGSDWHGPCQEGRWDSFVRGPTRDLRGPRRGPDRWRGRGIAMPPGVRELEEMACSESCRPGSTGIWTI